MLLDRITPACAGNSCTGIFLDVNRGDHPRVCGEQLIPALRKALRIGSPPRVRGTVFFAALVSAGCRITPACAGNRLPGNKPWRCRWDHPRVCGEQ